MTPSTDYFNQQRAGLPPGLWNRLRLGFTGTDHLLGIVGECLHSGDTAQASVSLASVAVDALASAVGENPLDGGLAADLLNIAPVRAILPEALINVLVVLARRWKKPADLSEFDELRAARDFPSIKGYAALMLQEDPANLFWVQQGLAAGLVDNDPDYVFGLLDRDRPAVLAPLWAAARAMATNAWPEDVPTNFWTDLGSSFGSIRRGLSLVRQDRDQGVSLLLEALRATPWNVSLALVLADLIQGLDRETVPLAGTTAVLLYTFNKADELDQTLGSLAGSELDGASLFVLDNGSTDHTPEVLGRWEARFAEMLGPDRFRRVALPVNIGAPAARNWLMSLPEVGGFDFSCYLDDDVDLPPDWLGRLGAAVARYPEAGVWGCKVSDHAAPALIQSADSHLAIHKPGPGTDPFGLTGLHARSLDQGLFDFMRPCTSVTGCCHLFRTQVLLESGEFSIHCSPSQYDDMEHDLRLALAGRFAVYQGHLRVLHKKRSGAASRTLPSDQGSALANKHKMLALHLCDDMAGAVRAKQAMLDRDLTAKMKLLSENLPS